MPLLLLTLPALLGAFERFEEVEGRGQAGQKAEEDDARDHGVDRAPGHVDQKLRQYHQRDKSEEQREDTHTAQYTADSGRPSAVSSARGSAIAGRTWASHRSDRSAMAKQRAAGRGKAGRQKPVVDRYKTAIIAS